MNTMDLQVDGMSCGSCIKRVTQALLPLPGVSGVDVDLPSGRVQVSGELVQGPDLLIGALTGLGYPAKLVSDASSAAASPLTKAAGCHSDSTGGCGCRRST
jgi:copper chaperone